ncbi:MAG: UDP-N-acetylmuramoyl-L-alanyl-D-glutamate--2,6-diaminopimelate ligase [Burkholderiaceae bacterium]
MASSGAGGRWLRESLASGARLSADSRRVGPGDGFLAFAGDRSDGRASIAQALEQGAAAVLFDADGVPKLPRTDIPMRGLPGLRQLAGEVASVFYDDPSAMLAVVAFTGTNGKTTCADWCAAGLAKRFATSASLGTLGLRRHPRGAAGFVAGDAPGMLTTPDAVALQDTLARLRDDGVGHVTIEASSIGIERRRLAGCRIAVAVFTNLSRDHLDYHGNMDAYAKAKSELFAMPGLRAAAIAGDDPAAAVMLARLPSGLPLIMFGERPVFPAGARLLRLRGLRPTAAGSILEIDGDFGAARVELPVLGSFNARNALAVLASWLLSGVPFETGCEWLRGLAPVPGRLQSVGGADAPLVVIDYAHTPDALVAVLEALRPNARARGGRLWCVFGCGGDRDAGKRPLMAAAAQAHADLVIVTSDNPRGESPQAIIDDIRAGFSRAPHAEIADRAQAIASAILNADAADVILLAGKGHEPYQEVAGERRPFSDQQVAQAGLAVRAGSLH